MRVLFLDCDFVLNNHEFTAREQARVDRESEKFSNPILTEAQWREIGERSFDPHNVLQLWRVVNQTGCKIVVSSTWRFHMDDMIEQIRRKRS